MEPEVLKHRLRGVIAFTPTPFTPDDRPDLDGLARHVDFLCRHGAHVVVVCGAVGEYFSLDLDEYRDCIRVAVETVNRRVPVLAGIGHSTRIACRLAEHAASVGADGLMINPMYFVRPPDEGVVLHYQELACAGGLGMMVFSTAGAVYGPAMVERLAEIPEVVALKDEYGDLGLFAETKDRLGDRLAWINGMAETLAGPYFAAGACAFTSGIVNFAPRLSVAVWEAGRDGRWNELNAIVATRVRPLARMRERRKGYQVAAVKEAMTMLGLPGGAVRLPLVPLAADDRDDLRRLLIELELLTP